MNSMIQSRSLKFKAKVFFFVKTNLYLQLCIYFILDSVKVQSDFTTDMIEASIKNWLKHAPNRLLKEK